MAENCTKCKAGPLIFSARQVGDGQCHICGHHEAVELRHENGRLLGLLRESNLRAESLDAAPAFHARPTVPGWWTWDISVDVYTRKLTQHAVDNWRGNCRVFGPIPPDPKGT